MSFLHPVLSFHAGRDGGPAVRFPRRGQRKRLSPCAQALRFELFCADRSLYPRCDSAWGRLMDQMLKLEHIRGVLVRLEETIIFGLIERAQFRRNPIIYEPGGMGAELDGRSLLDFLLRETEAAHARVRRYYSPDEHPFCRDLPDPVLPALDYAACPLQPNTVNINARIRRIYIDDIVPFICRSGDDQQYGSSAVNDVNLLQALSKRIHYGKFVAESKYRDDQPAYDRMIADRDANGLRDAITVRPVEDALFERVRRKTETYSRELAAAGETTIEPAAVVTIYADWIVPLSKDVEVEYLLQRTQDAADGASPQMRATRCGNGA